MLKTSRQQEEHQQHNHSVEGIVGRLVQAIKTTVQFVKELDIRKAHQWTQELMESYRYSRNLKKRFAEALEALTDLSLVQKTKIWEFIEKFLEPKLMEESVTRIS